MLLRRVPMVIAEHSTEPFAACDGAIGKIDFADRIDQPVFKALVVPLMMIMFKEFADRVPQRAFPEEDHAIQAALLDRTHEPLGIPAKRS